MAFEGPATAYEVQRGTKLAHSTVARRIKFLQTTTSAFVGLLQVVESSRFKTGLVRKKFDVTISGLAYVLSKKMTSDYDHAKVLIGRRSALFPLVFGRWLYLETLFGADTLIKSFLDVDIKYDPQGDRYDISCPSEFDDPPDSFVVAMEFSNGRKLKNREEFRMFLENAVYTAFFLSLKVNSKRGGLWFSFIKSDEKIRELINWYARDMYKISKEEMLNFNLIYSETLGRKRHNPIS